MSQPVRLAQVRYAMCLTWNMSITICWNSHSRDGVRLGAMVAQIELFTLKLYMDAFIPSQYH